MSDGLQLEGRNAVLEALDSDTQIEKIFYKSGQIEGSLKVVLARAKEKGIRMVAVDKQALDRMAESNAHQGVIALCPAFSYAELEDIFSLAEAKGQDPFVLVLDGITDPHNFGAIIRTAEAAGVHGIIIPKHRAAGVTGVVAKTSAGALAHVLICKVTNLRNTLEELKKRGLWAACADASGQLYTKASLSGPLALVIGGEGEGVGQLVTKTCDFTVSIPMNGRITSLNASVAAGVLMYEVVRQRNI